MAFYECTFIIRHDMALNDVTKTTDSFVQIINDGKGKVVKNENWGLRSLAYPINKANKGHYTMLALDCPHAALAEMERNMRINEDVIRFLTVKVDKMDGKPSVMLRQKNGEDTDEEVAAYARGD
jgi:small subunit ribosomal protein S6